MRPRALLTLALFAISCGSTPTTTPAPQPATPAPPQPQPASVAAPAASPEPEPAAAAPQRERHELTADDGHTLVVWSKAPPKPRGAIVLLHGRTWSARPDFDLQVPGESRSTMDSLAQAGFATYALDLRGYGDTKRDDSGWNTPDRATKDLLTTLEWVRERQGSTPALLGWSLGSLTAQLAAQRQPDLVAALILYGYPRSPDRKYKRDKDSGPPARAATTVEAALSDFIIPGNISDAASTAFGKQAVEADPIRSDWRGTYEWNELDPGRVTVPTLLMHGAKDPYAPVSSQSKLFQRLGVEDRAWVIIAGGDHAAHLEDVGPRFINAVVEFVGPRL